ncbi:MULTISPECIES: type I-E CRISPR-associated protein Cas5/CasD [Citrobacter]|jgi:CRISPR system Cascade subunit CasD|uniref:Type I-E CRISPR-associated protein Cas5/CasD n=1 Tax=Citrobacter amalonaticus TaxID=35703 RepID=A0A2S4RVX0_CITAM|nr:MULTISPECIES: type I-E CRISPR-associated protein Cas5/CasD [Citrobacter]EMC3651568.1 type I-E CRISPR-associated protein Cas5/CasD [Citrobacter braakii]KAA0555616.1 type I-E CRISPR-associated protein Cas5/CasD [Citrobacter braakii]MBJ8973451.1 type I-E CRISPR-associated protein Cas5/CasD [Citrobacter braakii]MBJ9225746.1 type I-E CRISPR-associated protein Cas5/CasD [Citrobacter braakii]MBJ9571395.1 type I-E CRISPR-associated protein Cas5/CasD [Citrobacter braakii]
MNRYLILRLAGPMQFWGLPTFEGTRPTAAFPTRSGLLGLLGACLGIRRNNKDSLQKLANSVRFAIRCDQKMVDSHPLKVTKIIDYHTVQDAREDYVGLKCHQTIQTWREYLCDASFTVAVWCLPSTDFNVEMLSEAVRKPYFTPYLGRRSCPMTEPLFVGDCQAVDPENALMNYAPTGGDIYCEEAVGSANQRFRMRDEPIISLPRQFAAREWFVIKGKRNVSE